MTFRKYKGKIDLDVLGRLVNNFLRKYRDAEVRCRGISGYLLLLGDEGIDFGVVSPSVLNFTSKNPTQISVNFANELLKKLNLYIVFEVLSQNGDTKTVTLEQLKLNRI